MLPVLPKIAMAAIIGLSAFAGSLMLLNVLNLTVTSPTHWPEISDELMKRPLFSKCKHSTVTFAPASGTTMVRAKICALLPLTITFLISLGMITYEKS